MGALPNPAKGTTLAELETVMRDSLIEFEERGVEEDDLTRVKSGIISSLIYGLESTSGKVSQLAAYATYHGDANGIGRPYQMTEILTDLLFRLRGQIPLLKYPIFIRLLFPMG